MWEIPCASSLWLRIYCNSKFPFKRWSSSLNEKMMGVQMARWQASRHLVQVQVWKITMESYCEKSGVLFVGWTYDVQNSSTIHLFHLVSTSAKLVCLAFVNSMCLRGSKASSPWCWYRLELSLDSIRHEVVAGMARAKSLLLFRTLLGPRKVLSQLGDLSIDSILCWSLWFDWDSKDLRLLVDDRCCVFRATTAWSTCGLSSGHDYGTRTSGAPFSPTCPDFVQGWTQDHLGLV